MRGMNSETVDLIATDPPFNKGKDFHATPDSLAAGAKFQDRWSWDDDVEQEWVDQIADDWPNVWYVIESARESWGDDMGAYLCFMGVRLIAMRRLLKPTGSIYLHCDPTASHYLKMLMDAVFDRRNFKNEIVWCYTGPSNTKRWFPRKHDIILAYTKGQDWVFNWEDVRVPYVKLDTGKTSGIFKQQALLDEEGKVPEDWWTQFTPVGRIKQERYGYPTQKPLALYERIIKASSNRGDLILDPFCGCATTCVAAEKLERQWVGIDIWEASRDAIVERMESTGLKAPKHTKRNRKSRDQFLFAVDFHFKSKLPKRTDGGDVDVPYLKAKDKIKPQEVSDGLSNAERKEKLIDAKGIVCQGCGRKFDDPRYLELDHNMPRSDGGPNNLSNRILLCSPCNRLKSHTFTLSGLIKQNKQLGYMKNPKLVEALK